MGLWITSSIDMLLHPGQRHGPSQLPPAAGVSPWETQTSFKSAGREGSDSRKFKIPRQPWDLKEREIQQHSPGETVANS